MLQRCDECRRWDVAYANVHPPPPPPPPGGVWALLSSELQGRSLQSGRARLLPSSSLTGQGSRKCSSLLLCICHPAGRLEGVHLLEVLPSHALKAFKGCTDITGPALMIVLSLQTYAES